MAKYIATFSDTIESIEISGFLVMSETDVDSYEELAESITWPFTYKFEDFELEYSNGEDLLSRIEFKELSLDETKTLKRLFNNEFGFFITESFLNEVIGDEGYGDLDDEYDDEDYYDDSRFNNYDDDDFDN